MTLPRPVSKSRFGVLYRAFVLGFVALVLYAPIGCGTTSVTTEIEKVPVPYWDPPENVRPLPPEPLLAGGDLTREEVERDVRAALRVLAQDLTLALEDAALVRWMYAELVKLVEATPAGETTLGTPSDADVPE